MHSFLLLSMLLFIFLGEVTTKAFFLGSADVNEDAILHMTHTTPVKEKQDRLSHVARKGEAKLIQLLIDLKTPVNFHDNFYRSPLTLACYKGRVASVKILLENGADVNNKINDKQGNVPLVQAIRGALNEEVISLLLEWKADINNQEGQTQESALHVALRGYNKTSVCLKHKKQFLAVIGILLKNDADITIADAFGKTPLIIAQENGPEIVAMIDCYYNKSYDGKLKAQKDYKKLVPEKVRDNITILEGIREMSSVRCPVLIELKK